MTGTVKLAGVSGSASAWMGSQGLPVLVMWFACIHSQADIYEGRRNDILDQRVMVKARTMTQREVHNLRLAGEAGYVTGRKVSLGNGGDWSQMV